MGYPLDMVIFHSYGSYATWNQRVSAILLVLDRFMAVCLLMSPSCTTCFGCSLQGIWVFGTGHSWSCNFFRRVPLNIAPSELSINEKHQDCEVLSGQGSKQLLDPRAVSNPLGSYILSSVTTVPSWLQPGGKILLPWWSPHVTPSAKALSKWALVNLMFFKVMLSCLCFICDEELVQAMWRYQRGSTIKTLEI